MAVNINSVRLPVLPTWTLVSDTDTQRVFTTTEGDVISIDFFAQKTQLPFGTMNDVDVVRRYFIEAAKKDGAACVSAEVLAMQGLRVLKTIIKMRNPPQISATGVSYLGSWIIPLADFSYTIKVQCAETGTAGLREAVLLTKFPGLNQYATKTRTGEANGNGVELSFADDDRYDEMFPEHPLSRCRNLLKYLQVKSKIDIVVRRSHAYAF
ncbi:hypothetical protein BC938DRAFT_471055 [Jimgerdemannia flammicorona]|uniref:Uncharacterized protein n=1 Tax=Jimgerdemannia flammicorona TaxID=994334 RepID=A0A433Q8Y7_9FUNG|nr:hypothetical protein BC938DRAFT_471055 [Jimgerdemannia flammicorona]